jgi:hypothetical protein
MVLGWSVRTAPWTGSSVPTSHSDHSTSRSQGGGRSRPQLVVSGTLLPGPTAALQLGLQNPLGRPTRPAHPMPFASAVRIATGNLTSLGRLSPSVAGVGGGGVTLGRRNWCRTLPVPELHA